jgi:CBS domain-containing protein
MSRAGGPGSGEPGPERSTRAGAWDRYWERFRRQQVEEHRGEDFDSFTLGREQRIITVTRARDAFSGRRVGDVMIHDPFMVSPDMPLDRFIDEVFLERRHTAYPVRDDTGEVVGILSVRDVVELPRAQWAQSRVADRMVGRDESLVLDADDLLADAMPKLSATHIRRALVTEDGQIGGLLSMTDAARMFEVLAGEDTGYLGGAPTGRFERAAPVKPTATA